jgi:hypothetical protein
MSEKKCHMAYQVNEKGGVTALCFLSPRAINLKVATWTNREEDVTCPKCLEQIGDNEYENEMRSTI